MSYGESELGVRTGAPGPQDAWTIQRILQWSAGYLAERGHSDTPRLDVEVLLAHALASTRLALYVNFDKPLSPSEREAFRGYLRRRGEGEPVAYITGVKEFMGHAFAVSPAVLIPRPDTEVLVEAALAELAATPAGGRAPAVLDVGTGSGCIALSLALRLAGARVVAWDVDAGALATARANADALGAAGVAFVQCDGLSAASWATDGCGDGERFDLIVSNPPYIAIGEEASLPRSVAGFEPRLALFGGDDGLAFYRAYAREAPRRLAAGGKLVVEIGATQADAVTTVFREAGWTMVRTLKDYGRNDRVVIASGAPGVPPGATSGSAHG